MSDVRRRFTVTAPDWGQAHLSSDAIVAFVDDELAAGPHTRALQHLAACPECAAEVVDQGQASAALRSAGGPSLPSSLLSSLRSIPLDTELPGPPAGLAMTADGQLVTVQRPAPAEAATVELSLPAGRRPAVQRRIRLGAGAAVSGLALGALAFGAPAAPTAPVPPERGVLGGSVLGGTAVSSSVVDARLRIGPAAAATEPGVEQLSRLPGSFRRLH